MSAVAQQPVPRTALTIEEAAESLGVSKNTLRRYVLPSIKSVRLGRAVVIPIPEIDRWLERHGTLNTPYN